jgi:hypothetical protein
MKRYLLLFLIFFTIASIDPVLAQQELTDAKYHLHAIGWNGEYWLIGGIALPHRLAFMAMYDGKDFTPVAPPVPALWIENISWNGSVWIIKEMGNVAGSKHRIYAYDGEKFRIVGTREVEAEKEIYKECNEEYCLIWNKSAEKLLKYYGDRYVDITQESGIQIPYEGVVLMRWNGDYWLIGTGGTEGGGVIKYDGETFTALRMPTSTAPSEMVWNGKYWLIGTLANPRFSGNLVRYDGDELIDLTPQLLESINRKERLTRDENITQKQKELRQKETPMSEENLTKEQREPQQPGKPLCGPTAVMLIFIVPMFFLSRFK